MKGNLIFDGEYLNGKKWNGKGYDNNNQIIYELKEGKGCVKECDVYGRIKFEGEYLNGKRNGKGKEYDFNGNIIFEGKYLNDKKWTGKGYKRNNIIYELKDGKGFINSEEFKGEYINGERNGKGKEYWDGNLIFEGEYLNGKQWNGKGYNNNQIIYELKDGNGLVDTKYFKGEIKNGERNGKEYNLLGKLIYEGEYLNGKRWNGNEKEYDYYDNIILKENI